VKRFLVCAEHVEDGDGMTFFDTRKEADEEAADIAKDLPGETVIVYEAKVRFKAQVERKITLNHEEVLDELVAANDTGQETKP